MTVTTVTQLANRALQKVGAKKINLSVGLLSENSKSADEVRACYDILRRAELRRNIWRFATREVALRALNKAMMQIQWAAWAAGTTYARNDVIKASDGQFYIATVGANLGNDPTLTVGFWTLYFGPIYAQQFVVAFSATATYANGQMAVGSNNTVYVSLVNNNIGNDPTVVPAAWASGTTYPLGKFVTGSDGNIYQSLVGGNLGNNPISDGGVHWQLLQQSLTSNFFGWDIAPIVQANMSFYAGEIVYTLGSGSVYISTVNNNTYNPTTDSTGSWYKVSVNPTLTSFNFIYPLGAGPESDATTRNVFLYPNGYERTAPQAPKAQHNAFLGGPQGLRADDWNHENNLFTSFVPGPIVFRFIADISDVSQFDPLFIEGLACRIGAEVCEPLTQSTEKIKTVLAEYKKFMGDARDGNFIEIGPIDPPLDEYLAIRS